VAAIGHPVLGDEFYGPFGVINQPNVEGSGNCATALIARHALHAGRLAFTHPITNAPLEFAAPLPVDFQNALERLSQLRA
jgi:23S rRNA pseudouridine1911/1915/1917 synthase